MSEFIKNNPYAELEAESVEASIKRFKTRYDQTGDQVDTGFEDPRLKATEAQMSSVGFSMETGQYIDLINR